jgi:hypothetical protein
MPSLPYSSGSSQGNLSIDIKVALEGSRGYIVPSGMSFHLPEIQDREHSDMAMMYGHDGVPKVPLCGWQRTADPRI